MAGLPNAKAFAIGKKHAGRKTEQAAVIMDARDALDVAPLPDGIGWPGYVVS
jgi:homogentisate 1,2-dioxygenase